MATAFLVGPAFCDPLLTFSQVFCQIPEGLAVSITFLRGTLRPREFLWSDAPSIVSKPVSPSSLPLQGPHVLTFLSLPVSSSFPVTGSLPRGTSLILLSGPASGGTRARQE